MLKSLREQALLIDDSLLSSGIKLIILPKSLDSVPKKKQKQKVKLNRNHRNKNK